MTDMEDDNLCVGICEADPEGIYCVGCGRPLFPAQPDDPRDTSLDTRHPSIAPAPESLTR